MARELVLFTAAGGGGDGGFGKDNKKNEDLMGGSHSYCDNRNDHTYHQNQIIRKII